MLELEWLGNGRTYDHHARTACRIGRSMSSTCSLKAHPSCIRVGGTAPPAPLRGGFFFVPGRGRRHPAPGGAPPGAPAAALVHHRFLEHRTESGRRTCALAGQVGPLIDAVLRPVWGAWSSRIRAVGFPAGAHCPGQEGVQAGPLLPLTRGRVRSGLTNGKPDSPPRRRHGCRRSDVGFCAAPLSSPTYGVARSARLQIGSLILAR